MLGIFARIILPFVLISVGCKFRQFEQNLDSKAAEASSFNASSVFLDSYTPLTLQLSAPLSEMFSNVNEDKYYSASILENSGIKYNVEVKLRGETSRSFCKFKKLKIRFPSVGSPETRMRSVFNNAKSFKIATHCDSDTYAESNVRLDRVTYDMFSLGGGVAFKTRLLKMTYIDTAVNSARNQETHDAFLIEDIDDLGDRVGLKEYDPGLESIDLPTAIKLRQKLNPRQAVLVAMRHLGFLKTDVNMLGIGLGHSKLVKNVKFLQDSRGQLFPIAFDNDGIVSVTGQAQRLFSVFPKLLATDFVKVPATFAPSTAPASRIHLWKLKELSEIFGEDLIRTRAQEILEEKFQFGEILAKANLTPSEKASFWVVEESFLCSLNVFLGKTTGDCN